MAPFSLHQPIHPCRRRASAAPVYKGLHSCLLPLETGLHITIGEIHDPPSYPQIDRNPLGVVSKRHPLHSASNYNRFPYHHSCSPSTIFRNCSSLSTVTPSSSAFSSFP